MLHEFWNSEEDIYDYNQFPGETRLYFPKPGGNYILGTVREETIHYREENCDSIHSDEAVENDVNMLGKFWTSKFSLGIGTCADRDEQYVTQEE